MTGENIVGGEMEEVRQGKPVSDKGKRLRVLKIGRSGAAGVALLPGSIGFVVAKNIASSK
ncbi:MAG: hypothetical protein CW342_09260 [Thermoactinomycetaceae bacterium]|nr:hypothetical protein [Bacillota bacterium]MBO2533060.1 hypothetical protein [Thermoactinomycetaceae bacterium]